MDDGECQINYKSLPSDINRKYIWTIQKTNRDIQSNFYLVAQLGYCHLVRDNITYKEWCGPAYDGHKAN